MTVKKFRLFLASDVHKEEEWLTEMSARGLQFRKQRLGLYYFDEDPDISYIYQIDFQQNIDKMYLQLYKDAGWEPVDEFMRVFHYFRKEAEAAGSERIYSDSASIEDSYRRMLKFYIFLFAALVLLNLPNLFFWQGFLVQKIAVSLLLFVFALCSFVFFSLRKKIQSFRKNEGT